MDFPGIFFTSVTDKKLPTYGFHKPDFLFVFNIGTSNYNNWFLIIYLLDMDMDMVTAYSLNKYFWGTYFECQSFKN